MFLCAFVIALNLLLFVPGCKIHNPLVKAFINKGFGEFKKYVVKTIDAELTGKIRIVETYNVQLQSHIDKIKSKCVHDPAMAG